MDEIEEEKVDYDKVEDQSPTNKHFTEGNLHTESHIIQDPSRASMMHSSFDNFDNHLNAFEHIQINSKRNT